MKNGGGREREREREGGREGETKIDRPACPELGTETRCISLLTLAPEPRAPLQVCSRCLQLSTCRGSGQLVKLP